MPKKSKNQIIRQNTGRYGDYNFMLQHTVAQLDVDSLLKIINPELEQKYNDLRNELKEYMSDEVKPKINTPGAMKIKNIGGIPEVKQEYLEVEKEVRKTVNGFIGDLEGNAKQYADYYKLSTRLLDPNLNYCDAMYNNQLYPALTLITGAGPLLHKKEVNGKTVIDYERIENGLRAPDGKGYFEPYMKICKAANMLYDAEIMRQKLEKTGMPVDGVKKYKEIYRKGLEGFTANFRDLQQTVLKYPNQWRMHQHLNNEQDEITGVINPGSREISQYVSMAEGYIVGLDNGFDIDELYIPGFVGYSKGMLDMYKLILEKEQNKYVEENREKLEQARLDPEKRENARFLQGYDRQMASFKTRSEGLNTVEGKLAELREGIYNKKNPTLLDKREMIKQIEEFNESVKDIKLKGDHTPNEWYEMYKESLDGVKTKLTIGLDDEMSRNDYLKGKVQHCLDVYGPNPKYNPLWKDKDVITQEDFAQYFPPVDMKNLPFTDMEVAFLGMAGTLTAEKEVLEAYKGTAEEGLSFDELIAKNDTAWKEDVTYEEYGPRANFTTYKGIAQAGRVNAVDAMSKYASGSKEELAGIIQRGLHNVQKSMNRTVTLNVNGQFYYAMTSTFTGMLRRDPGLLEEFNKYNEKQPVEKRVDLNSIAKIQQVTKAITDSQNDVQRYKDYEATYRENKKEWEKVTENPVYKNFGKDDPDYDTKVFNLNDALSLKNGIEDVYQRRKLGAMKHFVINDIIKYNDRYQKAKPEYILRNQQFQREVLEPGMAGKATADYAMFEYNNSTFDPYLEYISTLEGQEALGEFTDQMIEKYGLDLGVKDENLMIGGKNATDNENYGMECEKFRLECHNKVLLDKLRNNECSKEEIQSITEEYIKNNHQIHEIDNGISYGVRSKFSDKTEAYNDENYDKLVSYDNGVKSYVSKMDIFGMDTKELADMLENSTETLNEIADGLEAEYDIAHDTPEMRNNREFTELDDVVGGLDAVNHFVYKGSKEFDDIYKDMNALSKELNDAVSKYRESGIYPAGKFRKQEKELLDRMDVYINRKEMEKANGDKSKNSDKRLTAMKNAREKLNRRLKDDVKAPNVSADDLENIHNVSMAEERDTRAKDITGRQMLEEAMAETSRKMARCSKVLTAENLSSNAIPNEFYELKACAKNYLYLHILKDALGPKMGDEPAQIKLKDNMIKEKLNKGMDQRTNNTLDAIMETKFGKTYVKAVSGKAAEPNADYEDVFKEAEMIKLRDSALRTTYKDVNNKNNPNRTKDVRNVLNINEALGSDELKNEHKVFKEKEAAHKKKLEEQNKKKEGKQIEEQNKLQKK